MTTHLGLQRILLPSAQVSQLTTGSITLPSAGQTFIPPTDFQSIASALGNGTTTDFTFNSIPQTYKYLQIRITARSTGSYPGSDNLYIQYNGDTSTNYNNRSFYGYWTGTANAMDFLWNDSGVAYINVLNAMFGGGIASNYFTSTIIDIYDYSATDKVKIFDSYYSGSSGDSNSSTMGRTSGSWNSTAAITSVKVYAGTAPATGTVISLYGIVG
jgi:hypothetical protein